MKIIFKSKNQLIEKLVLDERLMLNEDTQKFSKNILINFYTNLEKKLKYFSEDISNNVKNLKNNTLENLIKQVTDIQNNKTKVPKKPIANDANAEAFKNSIQVFLGSLATFYEQIKNIEGINVNNDINIIKELDKSIYDTQARNILEWYKTNFTKLDSLIKNLNDLKTIFTNIASKYAENIKNSVNTILNGANNIRNIDMNSEAWADEEYQANFVENFNNLENKINKFITTVNNSIVNINQKHDLLNFILNDYTVINNSLNEINTTQENFYKNFNDYNDLRQTNTKYEKDLEQNTANIDWSAEFKNIWNNKALNAIERFKKINSTWNEYYNKVWPNNQDTIIELGDVFKDEVMKLGFTEEKNPFITFLKNLFNYKPPIKLTKNSYAAIHNSAAKGILSSSDLKEKDKNKLNLLLFNADLYTKSTTEILRYLNLYSEINKKLQTLVLNNSIISNKYENNKRNLVIDLFFEPGKPIAATENRIAGDPTGKLKKISDIEHEWFVISGDSVEETSTRTNSSANTIAAAAEGNKIKAQKIVQFLLTNYNSENKTISKEDVEKINTACNIPAEKFVYTPIESANMTKKFNNVANLQKIMPEAFELIAKNIFEKDLDLGK